MQDQETLQQKIVSSEEAFLDYWSEAEIIKEFGPEELEGALDQPVRQALISILSNGHKITDSEGKERTIRVMNASQLLDRINTIAEGPNRFNLEPIKRSNLYYHINALADKGFIKEVGLIPKKNRLISYYGRTARVFLLNYDKEQHTSFLEEDALPDLMKNINPELDDTQVNTLLNGLERMYRKVDTTPLHAWIGDNEQALRQSDMDIRTLHNIFYKILAFDDETIAGMRAFARAMGLELPNSS